MRERLRALAMRFAGAARGGAVIALAMFEYSDAPPKLLARTRYEYGVLGWRPASLKLVVLAPRDAILRKSLHPSPLQRSISIRDSLVALSVHTRLIRTPLAVAATRSEGAAGAGGGGGGGTLPMNPLYRIEPWPGSGAGL